MHRVFVGPPDNELRGAIPWKSNLVQLVLPSAKQRQPPKCTKNGG